MVVFFEQVRRGGRDPELLDLVELEVRDLFEELSFQGDDIPVDPWIGVDRRWKTIRHG
jgi:translation elongation factor EF-Tu-like GTPase